ncbi:hypothetical protein TWF481_007834 [Arthrobotrys musiformis]|uniref:IBR domain-containing protein n=1 Tax=Arthrobotrys musiformis TaxID=47236 RepID=A0AAV9W751_9PEZI
MDPIIEEDESMEPALFEPQTPFSNSSSRKEASSSASPADSDTSSSNHPIEEGTHQEEAVGGGRRQRRVFDIYTFSPSQQIPRDRLTDQPPATLWPPKGPVQCNYVLCSPELNEQYTASHQCRPGITKAQSTIGVDVESEILKLTKKERPTGGPLRSFSLKIAELPPPPLIPPSSSTAENECSRLDIPVLETCKRPKIPFRRRPLPVENNPQQRVSLIASGIKIPSKWGQTENASTPQKPYETRMCTGCDRYITLTKTQYVCNDIGCSNRLCDRCYNIWLDAKWEGRGIVTPERFRMAHTAAEIRQRYAKGMLRNANIPLEEKVRYIGEATAVAAGHSFVDEYNRIHRAGYKTDPSRYRKLNLTSLKQAFGKEEVEMHLLDSSMTKESCITASDEVGPGEFDDIESESSVNDDLALWGWDYATNKRDAAATGRTAPALPQVDYQPPTHVAPPSPSTSSLTIISAPEAVIGRAEVETLRSSSPSWTIWSLDSSDSLA